MKIYSLEGNRQKLDGGSMFGNAPKALWSRWYTPDDLDRITLACRSLLIDYKGEKILCETGIGAFFEPELADRYGVEPIDRHVLLQSLEKIGLSDSDIDWVILSHLHFDHAGGLLAPYSAQHPKQMKLLFPNAKFVVGQRAFERAKNPHIRDRVSFIPEIVNLLEESQRLLLVDGNHIKGLDSSCFSVFYTDGHTPGQMHLVCQSENEMERGKEGEIGRNLIFCGDLIPGSAWVNHSITMGYDRFPELLIDEKIRLYGHYLPNESDLFFYTHDPDYAASQIIKNEKGKFQAENKIKEFKGEVL